MFCGEVGAPLFGATLVFRYITGIVGVSPVNVVISVPVPIGIGASKLRGSVFSLQLKENLLVITFRIGLKSRFTSKILLFQVWFSNRRARWRKQVGNQQAALTAFSASAAAAASLPAAGYPGGSAAANGGQYLPDNTSNALHQGNISILVISTAHRSTLENVKA